MPTRATIEWPAGDTAARALGASSRVPSGAARFGLRALAILYRAGVELRNLTYDARVRRAHHANVPVISIGNVVAGGAGKTPFTRWLAAELVARGRRPAILHGGYGSDEPALHRNWLPTGIVIAAADRVRAATEAERQGADVIVLDDAFQHRRLARDLDIVLIPAEFKSADVLPLGPLREPVSALSRADVLIITRKTASLEQAREVAAGLRATTGKPVLVAAITPMLDAVTLPSGPILVVAGIARPDLLLTQLEARGVEVKKLLAYPDHHGYTVADAAHIRAAAGVNAIITTEKDAIKLLPMLTGANVVVIDQQVTIEDGADTLNDQIARVL